jgi:polygalacturonase
MKTTTVGSIGADITGSDSAAIQQAIDALAQQGGGTVRVLPGTYTCFDAIRLRSHVRLIGDKNSTILVHGPVPASPLAVDADIGEKQITPVNIKGFRPGMGIVLRDSTKPQAMAPMPLTIERIENGILYLNDWLIHDWCAENGGCVVAYTPLIHACEVEDVVVDGFTLDGSVANPPAELNGLWGGNLYFRRVQNAEIRNVKSLHAYGDGIRFGQSRNIIAEDCETHHNSHYGIHPGSHSRPVRFSRLHIHHNGSDGLYICWGVKNGLFEDCDIHHNGQRIHRSGISIGHKDTGNLLIRNHVYENCKYGVAIRKKTEANGAHGNTFRDNLIENNGSRKEDVPASLRDILPTDELAGCGIDILGVTRDLTFENNIIRDTRQGDSRLQRQGIRIHSGVSNVRMENNIIEGHPDGDVADRRV